VRISKKFKGKYSQTFHFITLPYLTFGAAECAFPISHRLQKSLGSFGKFQE